MSNSNFCTNCGTSVKEGAEFCISCGSRVKSGSGNLANVTVSRNKNSATKWALISFGIAVVLIGAGVVGWKVSQKQDVQMSTRHTTQDLKAPQDPNLVKLVDPNITMDSTPKFSSIPSDYLGLTNLPKMNLYYVGNNTTNPNGYIETITDPEVPGLDAQIKGFTQTSLSGLTWMNTTAIKEMPDESVKNVGFQSLLVSNEMPKNLLVLPADLKVGEQFSYTDNGQSFTNIILGTGTITLGGKTYDGLVVNQKSVNLANQSLNALETTIYIPGIGLAEQYLDMLSDKDGSKASRVYSYAGTMPAVNVNAFSGIVPIDTNTIMQNLQQ